MFFNILMFPQKRFRTANAQTGNVSEALVGWRVGRGMLVGDDRNR